MTTYSIFIGDKFIGSVDGFDVAYDCFESAMFIAEKTCQTVSVVRYNEEGASEIAYYDPEEINDDFEGIHDDLGFDPYAGCYTYDC